LTADDIVGYAEPETAQSYEIGMKGEFFDRRLRLNTSMFYVDYEDIQITLNVDVGGPLLVPSLANAGVAEIKGVEVELDAVPTDWLTIQASVGYIDAEYDSFSSAALNEFPNAASFAIQNTPEWTVHVGGTATFFDNDTGRLYFRTDYSWRDEQAKDFPNIVIQDSYGVLDASLTFATPDEKWLVSLGGTNLTDEIYLLSGVGDVDTSLGTASRPKEWYLRLKYNF